MPESLTETAWALFKGAVAQDYAEAAKSLPGKLAIAFCKSEHPQADPDTPVITTQPGVLKGATLVQGLFAPLWSVYLPACKQVVGDLNLQPRAWPTHVMADGPGNE